MRSHNKAGSNIGFLNDVRRLNVGITRARYSLIVIGNVELLRQHFCFAALIEYARSNSCLFDESKIRQFLKNLPKPSTKNVVPPKNSKLKLPSSVFVPPKKPVVPLKRESKDVKEKEGELKKQKSGDLEEGEVRLFIPPRGDDIDMEIKRHSSSAVVPAASSKKRRTIQLLPGDPRRKN